MASLKNRFEKIGGGAPALDFDPTKATQPELKNIPIELVEPDPSQPRTEIGDLTDLKASIREHGIIQPVIVSAVPGEERFRIIAGERRYTAAKELGLAEIPCVVRSVDEHRRLEVQLIENLHRKGFTPVEEANAYRRLREEFNLSQRQLADRLGKSVATINQTLRILSLPEDILSDLSTADHVSRAVLLEVAKQETPERQREMWESAKGGSLTVKAARAVKSQPADDDAAGGVVQRKGATRTTFRTTGGALVTVSFSEGEKAKPEIVAALTEALAEANRRV